MIDQLRDPGLRLRGLGEGKDGMFKLRQKELDANDGQTVLEQTRKARRRPRHQRAAAGRRGAERDRPVKPHGAPGDPLRDHADARARLLGSALFVWRHVGAKVLRRIANLQRAMLRLSEGDLDIETHHAPQNDEIAAMPSALEVFREGMIPARKLATDQDQDREAKAERTARMEAQIAGLKATMGGALDNLQRSANAMRATAQSMSATADRCNLLVSAVVAAEQTLGNVQSVCAGTGELSSSIAEIGRKP